jgi:AraC-like DNA-binding protein
MANIHLSNLASMLEAADRALAQYPVDPQVVFARAGIERTTDPDARMSVARTRAFWREAYKATNDPCIGFVMGQAILPANLHAVGYAVLASRTLRDGLDRLDRYDRMVSTGWDIRVREAGDQLEVSIHEVRPNTMPQEGLDASICTLVNMCRAVTDPEFKPRSIVMTRAEPPCANSLAQFFGCPVTYGGVINAVFLDLAAASRVLARQNPAVARANDDVVRQYLASFDKDDIVLRARIELIDLLPRGTPSRAEVAQALAVSERTLQRRLAAEGFTFRDLLAQTRHELALSYIAQRRHSILEIGFLLGFTDPSNFARAFRVWTGVSPNDFRTRPPTH